MKGQAYINEKDIFVNYGATLIRGAYEALLTPAAAKSYISNESRMQEWLPMPKTQEHRVESLLSMYSSKVLMKCLIYASMRLLLTLFLPGYLSLRCLDWVVYLRLFIQAVQSMAIMV